MELWIRSQDKEFLTKVNHLYSNDAGVIKQQDDLILGLYKSKERALEVLDEIQKLLQPQMILSRVGKPIAKTCDGTVYVNPDEYEMKELSNYIYEMPED